MYRPFKKLRLRIRSIWRMCGLIKAEFCNCCHQTLRIVPTFSPVTH